MSAYGAKTAKRQFAYANSPEIRKIDRGAQQSHVEFRRKSVSTTYRYINSAGRKCCNGTKDLKGTEILVIIICMPGYTRLQLHTSGIWGLRFYGCTYIGYTRSSIRLCGSKGLYAIRSTV